MPARSMRHLPCRAQPTRHCPSRCLSVSSLLVVGCSGSVALRLRSPSMALLWQLRDVIELITIKANVLTHRLVRSRIVADDLYLSPTVPILLDHTRNVRRIVGSGHVSRPNRIV